MIRPAAHSRLASDSGTIHSTVKELGEKGCWTVSSAKQGAGLDCLRDGQEGTFWQ
jgi:hypothetical protein